jgi:ribosome-associated translation inhibitor RaiA
MDPIAMTNLPIHITPHHLRLSSSLREFVLNKIAALPRFAKDIIAAEVVLRRHHGSSTGRHFSASARLAMPGHDVHGTAAQTKNRISSDTLELKEKQNSISAQAPAP